jgi:hypothetical protein
MLIYFFIFKMKSIIAANEKITFLF